MEQLVRLQDIDTKLKDLDDLLGDLPSKVEELDTKEQSIKNELDENKQNLKILGIEINKKEIDLSDSSIKIDKLKDQLYLVTNNKQYDALMVEIDHLKDQKSSFETDLINLMEEQEKTIENIKNMESNLEALSKDLVERRKKLKLAISDSADQKSDLENMRSKENQSHGVTGYKLSQLTGIDRRRIYEKNQSGELPSNKNGLFDLKTL